jgi:hypothetical protein
VRKRRTARSCAAVSQNPFSIPASQKIADPKNLERVQKSRIVPREIRPNNSNGLARAEIYCNRCECRFLALGRRQCFGERPLCAKSGRSLGPVDCSHEFNNLTNQRQEQLPQQAFANLAWRARFTAVGLAMR